MTAALGITGSESGLEGRVPEGGSALVSPQLALRAGQTIAFDWKFDFDDGPDWPDFGFFVLRRVDAASDPVIGVLATAADAGWLRREVTIAADGEYLIGFAATNAEDNSVSPILYVDNVFIG